MDNNKLLPLIGICGAVFFIWNAWVTEQSANPQPTQASTQQVAANSDTPALDPNASLAGSTDTSVPNLQGSSAAQSQMAENDGGVINVSTDVYNLTISLQGGTILRAGLTEYPLTLEQPDVPYDLLTSEVGDVFQLQTGLLSADDRPAPTHLAQFSAAQTDYQMTGDTLEVPLTWSENGIEVTKTFVFTAGNYDFRIDQTVQNNTAEPWNGGFYRQFRRVPPPGSGGFGTIQSYTGGAISSEENAYEKISFGDMEDENLDMNVTDGWVAMLQHYFIGALLPDEGSRNNFYTKNPSTENYLLGMTSQNIQTAAPNGSTTFSSHAYVGPKIQNTLEELAPNLQRAVDYGFLWFIAEPLFKALDFLHGIFGNWGWAIIFLTLIIKAIFFYPTAMSYKSMAKMRLLTPKMTDLRKRYSDDRAKQQQEMMKLYKKEKVNPLGGCLPMLIQIPVFISLYWMLNETVELRHAPWILWYEDLSVQDPYYILPILNGALMFFQQKLNPPPADPLQQKIFQWLPVFFTFLFLFFPAGLVLYWVVNSMVSIAQQWIINKRMERIGLGRKQTTPPPAK